MNRGALFLVGEGLKAAGKALPRLLLWALALAVTLMAGTALLVLPAGGRPGAPTSEALLVATLSPELSEREINELAWELWTLPEVVQVSFRFPGETDPLPVEARALVLLLAQPAQRGAVQEALLEKAGITGVQYLERTLKPPPRLPALARVLALVGLVLALGLTLVLGRESLLAVASRWGKALRLLAAAGVAEFTLRIPFLVVGALVGLVGGAVYVGVLWGAISWAGRYPQVREMVPGLFHCLPLAIGLGLSIGILLGMVGGLVGFPARRTHS